MNVESLEICPPKGMRSNLEKWNFWISKLEEKAMELIEKESLGDSPLIYQVKNDQVHSLEVTKIGYNYLSDRIKVYFSMRKPTKEDVERIREHALNAELTRENISLSYRYWETENIMLKGSYRIGFIEENDKLFMTKDEAEQALEGIRKQKSLEQNLLNDGGSVCAFCSKVSPKGEGVTMSVSTKSGGTEARTYCSQEHGINDGISAFT